MEATIIIFDSEDNFEEQLWRILDAVSFPMLLDGNVVIIDCNSERPGVSIRLNVERFDSRGNFEVEL